MSLDVSLRINQCPTCKRTEIVFDWSGMTHNMTTMADNAGIYYALWMPEEINAVYAKDIVEILEKGLKKMKARPSFYKKFNPSNGWGSYDGFLQFVEAYYTACKNNPDAIIEVDR